MAGTASARRTRSAAEDSIRGTAEAVSGSLDPPTDNHEDGPPIITERERMTGRARHETNASLPNILRGIC